MPYKIIITKEETVTKKDSDWRQVADTGNEKDDGAVYAYVEHEIEQDISVEVFRQRVDDIDLVAVIDAINKPKGDHNV